LKGRREHLQVDEVVGRSEGSDLTGDGRVLSIVGEVALDLTFVES